MLTSMFTRSGRAMAILAMLEHGRDARGTMPASRPALRRCAGGQGCGTGWRGKPLLECGREAAAFLPHACFRQERAMAILAMLEHGRDALGTVPASRPALRGRGGGQESGTGWRGKPLLECGREAAAFLPHACFRQERAMAILAMLGHGRDARGTVPASRPALRGGRPEGGGAKAGAAAPALQGTAQDHSVGMDENL